VILEALYARERSGEGAALEIALFAATAEWMAVPLLHHEYGGGAPERVGLRHPSIAPYGAFPTGDGTAIILGIQNEREWQRFCAGVLGDAALAADPRFDDNVKRVAHRAALDAIVAARFAGKSREAVAALLAAAGIAYGRLNSVADLAGHPQLHRVTVEAGGEAIALPAPASGHAAAAPVPDLDQHGAALRREFAV
jgi:crotonobetainyl-CoA:carnitine CoA-transferase CaiB-like acyl-CoA transferase